MAQSCSDVACMFLWWVDYTKAPLTSFASAEAKYFVDAVYGKGDDPELPPVCDFECRKNVPINVNAHLWNWLDYVEDKTGRVPMIYTGYYYWKEYGSPHLAWKKYPLWIANYGAVRPIIPLPWTDFTFWQYTDKGNGAQYGVESKLIDLNQFNGSYEDLLKLCGKTPPTVPPTLTFEEKVDLLYEQGKLHGWTLHRRRNNDTK